MSKRAQQLGLDGVTWSRWACLDHAAWMTGGMEGETGEREGRGVSEREVGCRTTRCGDHPWQSLTDRDKSLSLIYSSVPTLAGVWERAGWAFFTWVNCGPYLNLYGLAPRPKAPWLYSGELPLCALLPWWVLRIGPSLGFLPPSGFPGQCRRQM